MNGTMHNQIGRSDYLAAVDAWVAMFEPGDATHYEFMWCAGPTLGFVRVAGSPNLGMYEYNIESIERCYEEYKALVGTGRLPGRVQEDKKGGKKFVMEPYLGYIVGHSGNCNPYTAWAMVQCIAEHLLWLSEEKDADGQ